MPSFTIPRWPRIHLLRTRSDMSWDELVEMCNSALDNHHDVIASTDKPEDVLKALKGGDKKSREWALRQLNKNLGTLRLEHITQYYSDLKVAVEAALESEAISKLHRSVTEDLSVAVFNESMPADLRISVENALRAVLVWEEEHDRDQMSRQSTSVAQAFESAEKQNGGGSGSTEIQEVAVA